MANETVTRTSDDKEPAVAANEPLTSNEPLATDAESQRKDGSSLTSLPKAETEAVPSLRRRTMNGARRLSSALLGDKQESIQVDVSPMNPKYTAREHRFIVFLATLLAFNSGFSNGLSLSGFLAPAGSELYPAQSTSGYTGVYTSGALALASSSFQTYHRTNQNETNIQFFGFQTCMVLSFVSGATISGVLNPRPSPWKMAPMYAPTFLLGAIFMCIAAVLAYAEPSMREPHRHQFFYFVALANGIQNGISSMYSANLIRTTHMTGPSTDIGLFMGQVLRGNYANVWRLKILVALVVSFWTGGFLSVYAVREWRTDALFFNAAVFLFLFALIVLFLIRNLHVPLLGALRGTWHWQRTLHVLSVRCDATGKAKPDDRLLSVFNAMDVDEDGYLTLNELYHGLQVLGCTDITMEQVRDMFDVCDRDLDGLISSKEWCDLIRGDNVFVG